MRRIVLVTAIVGVACLGFAQAAPTGLLVSDADTDQVRLHDAATGAFLGNFTSGGALNFPIGFRFGPDGNLYVGSYSGDSDVERFDGTTGVFMDQFVTPNSGDLNTAYDVEFGPDGNLYVASFGTPAVKRYNGVTGEYMDDFVPDGSGGIATPQQLRFHGGYLYVATGDADAVLRYDATTGAFVDQFIPAGTGGLNNAMGFDWGPDGLFYIVGQDTSAVLRFSAQTGAFVDQFVTGLGSPRFLAFGPDGNLYVTESSYGVQRFDGATGAFLDDFAAVGNARYLAFVPEPTTAVLLLCGFLAFSRKR